MNKDNITIRCKYCGETFHEDMFTVLLDFGTLEIWCPNGCPVLLERLQDVTDMAEVAKKTNSTPILPQPLHQKKEAIIKVKVPQAFTVKEAYDAAGEIGEISGEYSTSNPLWALLEKIMKQLSEFAVKNNAVMLEQ